MCDGGGSGGGGALCVDVVVAERVGVLAMVTVIKNVKINRITENIVKIFPKKILSQTERRRFN